MLVLKLIVSRFLCFSLLFITATVSAENHQAAQIRYLLQSGQQEQAFARYRAYQKSLGHHDTELLEEMGLAILMQGARSKDPEIQLLALFGSSTAANERVLPIVEEGIRSSSPLIQLLSMDLLAQFESEKADRSIARAINSPYLLIRLEGICQLMERNPSLALGQLDAIACKVEPEVVGLLAQIYAIAGTPESTRALRRLITSANPVISIPTILVVAKHGNDALLPTLRSLATHHHSLQQEASAFALGELRDESSIPQLKTLAKSSASNVRIAALLALYRLGNTDVFQQLSLEAKQGNVFAIISLGEVSGSANTLATFLQSEQSQIRLNAAFALLEQHDPRSITPLREIFIRDNRDLIVEITPSPASTLIAYKTVSAASVSSDKRDEMRELSLEIREETLRKAVQLPEDDFLRLAQEIFRSRQNDLVPTLTCILEELATPQAIDLLRTYQQASGAPLLRAYCTLALFRLGEQGPYRENLRQWVRSKMGEPIVHFRPLIASEKSTVGSLFQLTPQETTRVFVDSLVALLEQYDESDIDLLIDLIDKGNAQNKYVLAGLLVRIAQ